MAKLTPSEFCDKAEVELDLVVKMNLVCSQDGKMWALESECFARIYTLRRKGAHSQCCTSANPYFLV